MEERATRRILPDRWKLTTNMDWWRNGFLHRGAMTGREDGAMRHGSGELLEMQQRISRQTFTVAARTDWGGRPTVVRERMY